MNKAYIVTSGDYSDYHIVKVFCNKEKAELYIKCQKYGDNYSDFEIEEYDIEEEVPQECFSNKYIVAGWIRINKCTNNIKLINISFRLYKEGIKLNTIDNDMFYVQVGKPRKNESPEKFHERSKKIFYDNWYQYLSDNGYSEVKNEFCNYKRKCDKRI